MDLATHTTEEKLFLVQAVIGTSSAAALPRELISLPFAAAGYQIANMGNVDSLGGAYGTVPSREGRATLSSS
jgi:hypothetical protein